MPGIPELLIILVILGIIGFGFVALWALKKASSPGPKPAAPPRPVASGQNAHRVEPVVSALEPEAISAPEVAPVPEAAAAPEVASVPEETAGSPEVLAALTLDGATRVATPAAIDPLAGPTRTASPAGLPETLGSYRILSLLGAGGMGTVVRARHTHEGWARRQGGDGAIKFIHPEIASDPQFVERFLDEAELGKRVTHPGLCRVHDVIAESSWLGMVMELVEGQTLDTRAQPGGLPLDEADALLRPVALALDHLHGQGVVHRDLKPRNIMLRPGGEPVILDLGIAKDTLKSSGHTRTMTTMGTSAWMAPEQADAKTVGPEADRYALGMIAYLLLSGRMPWAEETSEMRVIAFKMTGQLTPLETVAAHLRPDISEKVMRMLSMDPGSRFGSCLQFVEALSDAPRL